ncbi:hypothetical protein Cgig2_021349 [Carnegiea gigantea]|uniref:Uncharacterized protein n=1 Tax=Carnegiea gigantea TaxID=171969 RepID=A0A9Q1JYH4_9CARY|nr:hypothetical protein Cgig2_021349 [Carnegiea gigantea]
MAMPDLVAGGAACAVPGSSSASNPLGALANVLIGSSSKTQIHHQQLRLFCQHFWAATELQNLNLEWGTWSCREDGVINISQDAQGIHQLHTSFWNAGDAIKRLKEIPTSTFLGSSSYTNSETQLATLPGLESDYQLNQHSSGQDSAFLHGFCTAGHGDLAQAWNEIHTIQIPDWQHLQIESNFPQSSHIYNYLLPSQPQVLDGKNCLFVVVFDCLNKLGSILTGISVVGSGYQPSSSMNSKFLQFVSKMSRGELFIEDNQVKEGSVSAGDWAAEYQNQRVGGPSWAEQFSHEENSTNYKRSDW